MAKKNNKAEQLSQLVEWWLQDKEVDVTYHPNPRGRGQIIPEFDVVLWLNGRKIVMKTLAMLMQADLMARGYNYTIANVYSALVRFTWVHYTQAQEYPDWLARQGLTTLKRPRGRPRTKPKAVAVAT